MSGVFLVVRCSAVDHGSIFFALYFSHNHCALSCLKRPWYKNCFSKGMDLHVPVCFSRSWLTTVGNSFSGCVIMLTMCQALFSPNAHIKFTMWSYCCLRGSKKGPELLQVPGLKVAGHQSLSLCHAASYKYNLVDGFEIWRAFGIIGS